MGWAKGGSRGWFLPLRQSMTVKTNVHTQKTTRRYVKKAKENVGIEHTKREPEENGTRLLCAAEAVEALLEVITFVGMWVRVWVLATWLCPGRDRSDETEIENLNGDEEREANRHLRDQQADGESRAGKDEANTEFFQCTRKPRALVVLLIDDGSEEHKQ